MRALSLVGVGLLVVFLDFRVGGVDVVLDPVGWAMVAIGASRLRDRHPAGFDLARLAAVAATVVSGIDIVLAVLGPGASVWTAALVTVLDLAVVWGLCSAISDLLAGSDERSARAARTIRAGDVVVTVLALPLLFWAASLGLDPGGLELGSLTWLALAVLVVGIVLRLWLVVLVFRVAEAVEEPPSAPLAQELHTADTADPDPVTP